jgi:hypothetical protein
VLRRSWAWGQLRRVQDQGVARSIARHRLWVKALDTAPVPTRPLDAPAPYEMHLLCYFSDYLPAIWALKSYLLRVGADPHLYIHLQGRHTRLMQARLHRQFPQAELVPQEAADRIVIPELKRRGLHRLATLRAMSACMLKLTDIATVGRSKRVLVLDGDVLFFRRPDVLHDALLGREPVALFQKDAFTSYVIEPERAQADLGIPLLARLNSGVVAIDRHVIDLGLCDRLLGNRALVGDDEDRGLEAFPPQVEQTLYALAASASGLARWLPDDYALSMEAEPRPGAIVSRHYSGPSRTFMSSDGMPWLTGEGLVAGRSGARG